MTDHFRKIVRKCYYRATFDDSVERRFVDRVDTVGIVQRFRVVRSMKVDNCFGNVKRKVRLLVDMSQFQRLGERKGLADLEGDGKRPPGWFWRLVDGGLELAIARWRG